MRAEHVGSTSVRGLSARPIIDVDVVIRARTELAQVVERLAAVGYVHEGDCGIDGREAFKPARRAPRGRIISTSARGTRSSSDATWHFATGYVHQPAIAMPTRQGGLATRPLRSATVIRAVDTVI
jgi:GrpB-like predicted nucleotidyltransferase (UPF0157 family)